MKLKDLGEFNFIEKITRGLRGSSRVIKGIGDDTAVLRFTRDRYLLFTCDMLVEGRHFYKKDAPYKIGKKALCVNISDIAAMGGVPTAAVVSLGVPGALNLKYADELYKGIGDTARRFKIDLAGGDTVSSEKIIINISLLGEVEKKNLILRSGARRGDAVFVTGNIGGSFKGRHLDFTPRLKEARFLAKNFNIHSMIDVSDGLIADLGHILRTSKVGALIYERDVPVSKNARDFSSAITDGEDFELVFTLSQGEGRRLKRSWPFAGRLTEIGRVSTRRHGLSVVRKDGKKQSVRPVGFTHF